MSVYPLLRDPFACHQSPQRCPVQAHSLHPGVCLPEVLRQATVPWLSWLGYFWRLSVGYFCRSLLALDLSDISSQWGTDHAPWAGMLQKWCLCSPWSNLATRGASTSHCCWPLMLSSPAEMSLISSIVITKHFWRDTLRVCKTFLDPRSCPRFHTQCWFSPGLIVAVMVAQWWFSNYIIGTPHLLASF